MMGHKTCYAVIDKFFVPSLLTVTLSGQMNYQK